MIRMSKNKVHGDFRFRSYYIFCRNNSGGCAGSGFLEDINASTYIACTLNVFEDQIFPKFKHKTQRFPKRCLVK